MSLTEGGNGTTARVLRLLDLLQSRPVWSGTELAERGLYLDLGPWQYHVFDMKPADPWNRRAEP